MRQPVRRRPLTAALCAAVVSSLVLVLAPAASAHVERPSYWPDPAPDCSVSPCAGGAVPTIRTIDSAVAPNQIGVTRVVCQPNSLQLARQEIAAAQTTGWNERPTVHLTLSAARARQLLHINQVLFGACAYSEIQTAVTASGNNDRVVVMPGVYTEPTSRAQPTHDHACDGYRVLADSGDPGALSHDYQVHCPNDANLIAVIGRGLDTGPVPQPALVNRHGVPNAGPCIRCNVQLEGSGPSPDDVVVDNGSVAAGNGGPSGIGSAKDVGLFVDRADGFVMRNMTFRHAREHDIYILETDGYVFDSFKAFYAGGYGVLTFVEDHGLIQHCETAGNGDSGIYPGAGADTSDQRYLPFYPVQRWSQTVQYCDSHHNTGGFSGTNSHGTLIQHNNFYGNALGFTTDVFTAPGHPGFPQHGNQLLDNNFYANNFNPYVAASDVQPFIAAPVGTGMWIAGGNNNQVTNNHFWDNYRRGMMLFAVPDATVCGPPPVGSSTPVPGCDQTKVSTSFGNSVSGNSFGVAPNKQAKPNGLDIWWDSFPGNTGNCFWNNSSASGLVSSSPVLLPDCLGGTTPALSVGTGNPSAEAELAACLAGFTISGYPAGNSTACDWTTTPPKPGAAPAVPGVNTLLQQQEFNSICQAGLAVRLCSAVAPVVNGVIGSLFGTTSPAAAPLITAAPVFTDGRLSTFTCSWWRQATPGQQLGMVNRIQAFAGGPVNGGPGANLFGYGASIGTNRTIQLFNDRCSFTGAGAFALYKIYGAAAPFSALS